jgi:CO/xanthine dehydrogenase FAD-binding subunit
VESRPVAIDATGFLGRPASEIAADLCEHAAVSVTPMEDHSASADYRIALTKVLVQRAVNDALAMARQQRDRLQ